MTATDRWFTVAAATTLLAVCAWRLLARRGRARVVLVPIVLPAMVFAAATGAHAIALSRMPLEDPGNPAFQLIFDVQNAAVILLAAGLAMGAVMTVVHRRGVARIVASLGEAPAPGSLESALARALGDPELRVAYWLPDVHSYVDAQGRPVAEPAAAPGRLVTALMQQDRRVAMVSHAATLPELEREFGAAIRLGVENERLQAEILFQLSEVRASRARIVQTGDAEQRRLERNLHDGAQQRILALSYDIRLAHEILRPAVGVAVEELAHDIFRAQLGAHRSFPLTAGTADRSCARMLGRVVMPMVPFVPGLARAPRASGSTT